MDQCTGTLPANVNGAGSVKRIKDRERGEISVGRSVNTAGPYTTMWTVIGVAT
jgi:hypothetical protein